MLPACAGGARGGLRASATHTRAGVNRSKSLDSPPLSSPPLDSPRLPSTPLDSPRLPSTLAPGALVVGRWWSVYRPARGAHCTHLAAGRRTNLTLRGVSFCRRHRQALDVCRTRSRLPGAYPCTHMCIPMHTHVHMCTRMCTRMHTTALGTFLSIAHPSPIPNVNPNPNGNPDPKPAEPMRAYP